jgi:hypothetical protein
MHSVDSVAEHPGGAGGGPAATASANPAGQGIELSPMKPNNNAVNNNAPPGASNTAPNNNPVNNNAGGNSTNSSSAVYRPPSRSTNSKTTTTTAGISRGPGKGGIPAHSSALTTSARPVQRRSNEEVPLTEFESPLYVGVREFLRRWKTRAGLGQLHKMLTERDSAVTEELVTVINKKYVDFLELSGSTKKLEGLVKPIAEPLRRKTEAVAAFCGELDEVRGKF